MYESSSGDAGRDSTGCGPAVNHTDSHGRRTSRQGSVVERLSRYGKQVMPTAFQRRSRLQRQPDVSDCSATGALQREGPERASLTPAMRRTYLKELLLSNSSNSGLNNVLSSQSYSVSAEQDSGWALSPMEHVWMLSAVEANYETILDYISADPLLLTRKDFISGYSVLHWLAKRGQDETMIRVLRYAESAGITVNVNVRGSGGLTPLHVASMHRQYMVIKVLVGAFGANVDAMDHSGKRPWQYLKEDAPPDMKELLGAWDDEHCCEWAQNLNNSSSGSVEVAACNDVIDGQTHEVVPFDRTERGSHWMFDSFRRLLPSLSFLGNKSWVVMTDVKYVRYFSVTGILAVHNAEDTLLKSSYEAMFALNDKSSREKKQPSPSIETYFQ